MSAVTLRKLLFSFPLFPMASRSRKTRVGSTIRWALNEMISVHRPLMNVYIDTNTAIGFHPRDSVHDVQYKQFGQRRMVPR